MSEMNDQKNTGTAARTSGEKYRQIRQQNQRYSCCFLTVSNEVGDETKGFDLGVVDVINKPASSPIQPSRPETHRLLLTFCHKNYNWIRS
jgi:hypothetical protein